MEPVTHALASVALARAGLSQKTRLAVPMTLAAGLAADLDLVSALNGAGAYVRFHRTLTHSLLGTVALATVVAGVFWWFGRGHREKPIRYAPAFLLCLATAGLHVLMDATNPHGVQFLWPFRDKWHAWDLMDSVDPWVLLMLLAGLLLPLLFRLVTEEIGARVEQRGPQRGAVIALAALALYAGTRYMLRDRAVEMLNSRVFHGAVPLSTAVFPSPVSPLKWNAVVETENTLEELEVPLAPGSYFNPDMSRTNYKPEASPALDAARKTKTLRAFLKFARIPRATVELLENGAGYRVTVRDLRFASLNLEKRGVLAIIELNQEMKVIKEEIVFARDKSLSD